jgi:dynein heavy chain
MHVHPCPHYCTSRALCLQVSDDTLNTIFGTILDYHLTSQHFPDAVKALSKDLVAATLAVYSTATTKLLPTPTKSHYLFNLRDFARVVQVCLTLWLAACGSRLLCWF